MKQRTIFAATILGFAMAAAAPAVAGPKHCPPGHAKKGWCTPSHYSGPASRWRRGDRLPRERYVVINNYYEYGWPEPEPDHYYVIVDGKYFLIQAATGLILDALLR